jgi:hypothetical protein
MAAGNCWSEVLLLQKVARLLRAASAVESSPNVRAAARPATTPLDDHRKRRRLESVCAEILVVMWNLLSSAPCAMC